MLFGRLIDVNIMLKYIQQINSVNLWVVIVETKFTIIGLHVLVWLLMVKGVS